jgi:hypothetical protein
MTQHGKGAVGLGNRHTPEFHNQQQRYNSPHYPHGQAPDLNRRTQRLDARAAAVMQGLALTDAKAAMRCIQEEERAELRASAAILNRWSQRLRQAVPQ